MIYLYSKCAFFAAKLMAAILFEAGIVYILRRGTTVNLKRVNSEWFSSKKFPCYPISNFERL
jgi:hypothetical protein